VKTRSIRNFFSASDLEKYLSLMLEVVSKPGISPGGKAQADPKAQHARQYVSISGGRQHRHRALDGVMKHF
jgi:hypothetical protein